MTPLRLLRPLPRLLMVLLLALVLCQAHGGQEEVPYELVLTGSCDAQAALDGEPFRLGGYTLDGSPFYEALGAEVYIYYDRDCDASGEGNPRWILDKDRPNLTAASDLDRDGLCDYHARINSPPSEDHRRPPTRGHWTMQCHDNWRSQYLILLEVTSTRTSSTATSTSETSTTTSNTQTTTTESTTTMSTSMESTSTKSTSTTVATTTTTSQTVSSGLEAAAGERAEDAGAGGAVGEAQGTNLFAAAPQMLVLSGACDFNGKLNGLTFVLVGVNANGEPWYKASDAEEYLYHDPACDGRRESGLPGRWIIDADRPSLSAHSDLDGDGRCNYYARFDSAQGARWRPPAQARWRMYCGTREGWQDVELRLDTVTVDPRQEQGDQAMSFARGAMTRTASTWRTSAAAAWILLLHVSSLLRL